MKYNIFGSALVLVTTVLPAFVQGAPTKNIAARDVQILNRQPTGRLYYAFKSNGQDARPETTTNFVVENTDPLQRICIWAENGNGFIRDPESGSEKFCLNPGQSLQFGNIAGPNNGNGFSGTLRGFVGCDSYGNNCNGGTEALGAVSKVEWTYEPSSRKGWIAINLSLVDGYNLATAITFGPGTNCIPLRCDIPQRKLENICPAQSKIWDRGGVVGCKSQCRTDNTDEHCCHGSFTNERCPQSSTYFIDACPAAMAFPFDHEQYRATFPRARVQTCDAGGEVKVQFRVA